MGKAEQTQSTYLVPE